MRIVVGYTATARGRDALYLATALARGQDASVDVVMAVPEFSPYSGASATESGYESLLQEQVQQWLDEALAVIPADVPAQGHMRRGESEAETLIAAAQEFDARLLVIGASSSGLFKRFAIGSVGAALLHAATIPVALAPAGYSRSEAISKITCAVGTRAGAPDVLGVAVAMAERRELPLRLVSLLALGHDDASGQVEAAKDHLRSLAETNGDDGASALKALQPEIVVGQGRSIENAVDSLDWADSEVLLIGSSRLARDASLFLGATASRILRSLPIPMIVVPRNFQIRSINANDDGTTKETP